MASDIDAQAFSDRRVITGLCLGSFVTVLTFAAPAPFLPEMARDLGTTVPVLGQVTALMLLTSAALGLVLGPLADRFGHRRLILLGLAAAVLTQMVYGLAPIFQLLFLASIVGAVADATVPGLSLAIASTHFSGQAARRAVGWTVAALASSPIFGVPLLTAIGGLTSWRVSFATATMMTLVVIVVVTRSLPPDPPPAAERVPVRHVFATYRPLLQHRMMMRLYASCVLRGFCWFGILTYLGAFLNEELGLSTPQVGLVYMLGGSGYFIGSLFAAGPISAIPALPLLAVGNGTMGVLTGVILMGRLDRAVTIGLVPVLAFAAAIGWVGLVGLLSDASPVGSGTTMVLNSSLLNLGAFGGSAVGGLVVSLGGYSALALALPGIGILSAVVIWSGRRGSSGLLDEHLERVSLDS